MAPATVSATLSDLAWEQLPLAVLLVDPKGRVVSANQAACTTLKLSPDQILGKHPNDIIQTSDPTWCSTDPVDRLGAPTVGRKLKARINGNRRVLRVGVYPVQEPGSEGDAGTMVTLRDARASDSDPQENKDNLTSLGELSACVAHEIRNPLTGIRTTVQFVDSKLDPEDPRREDLGEVINEIDRIEQIIEDLLLFARPVEGQRMLTDLNAFLGRVLDAMGPQLAQAEVQVRRKFSPELPPFLLSPDNMQQVVHNLIRNAIEAMPEGGRVKVTTSIRRFRTERAPVAEISISDTGHGIPEDLVDTIFKPFFTTRHNGTGLGLPITASIVKAHGGRIYGRNRAHGGATFRIVLPLETKEAGAS